MSLLMQMPFMQWTFAPMPHCDCVIRAASPHPTSPVQWLRLKMSLFCVLAAIDRGGAGFLSRGD
jgi:hypothetical protein